MSVSLVNHVFVNSAHKTEKKPVFLRQIRGAQTLKSRFLRGSETFFFKKNHFLWAEFTLFWPFLRAELTKMTPKKPLFF